MLSDHVFSLTMTFDDSSADVVAVLVENGEQPTTVAEWTTTEVEGHTDNQWHTVRDLLLQFIEGSF